jgi:integration host factor subunit beta
MGGGNTEEKFGVRRSELRVFLRDYKSSLGRRSRRKGGENMNKAELITKVSEKANVTQKVAKVIVDTLFDGMKESLEKGERIEIRGFGSFVVRNYGGYKGRNPKTGEIVEVPPKKLPFFKVGKELKEMVNIEGA